MELKAYQDRALQALRTFLSAARVKPPAQAYAETIAGANLGNYSRGGYTPVEGLTATSWPRSPRPTLTKSDRSCSIRRCQPPKAMKRRWTC